MGDGATLPSRYNENASEHQRDAVMNETTFYEGTTHEPAMGPTSTSLETVHETITQEISNHGTPALDIRPREDDSRNPRLAEEEYEDHHSTRSHTHSRGGGRTYMRES